MKEDLDILIDFLGRFGSEVSGRGTAEPDAGVTAKLERFARGECARDERREICELLRSEPAWLRWLANRVRMARTQGEPQP